MISCGLPSRTTKACNLGRAAESWSAFPHSPNVISLIASLADFYDALSTARPYKRAIPPAKAVAIIAETEDAKMEPRLRRLFLEMLGQYPIGSVVKLDTGELGVVGMRNAEDLARPEVIVVTEPDGTALIEEASVSLTETDADGEYARSIVEAVDPMDVEVDPLAVLQKVLRTYIQQTSPALMRQAEPEPGNGDEPPEEGAPPSPPAGAD